MMRNLILASVILAALVGALYWSDHRKSEDDTAKASTDTSPIILKLDSGSITKLELKDKDGAPIALAKDNSGTWQITEPQSLPADQSAVASTLSSLSSLNSERLVDEKITDVKPYGLDPPATEIDITQKDNKTQKLLLGDQTPTGSAVYAMLAGDPRLFTLPTYEKTGIDKSVNDLRDKRLLTVDPDKISRIDLERDNKKHEEIEFGRNKQEWQILKPKPLRADDIQVGDLARKLSEARMELTGTSEKDAASAFARSTPIATIKVTDPSGTQELQIRKGADKTDKDLYYAKSSVVTGTYKVDSSLGTAVDKSLDNFRDKKIFDFGFNDPDRIEMHSGSKAYFLTKGGNDWWGPDGKKMDADAAQSFLSQLRDLTATKFVDSGFADPTLDLTVTSDHGKRVEKVSIAKSDDHYLARRENDPTIYQLDSSAIDSLQKSADNLKSAVTASESKGK